MRREMKTTPLICPAVLVCLYSIVHVIVSWQFMLWYVLHSETYFKIINCFPNELDRISNDTYFFSLKNLHIFVCKGKLYVFTTNFKSPYLEWRLSDGVKRPRVLIDQKSSEQIYCVGYKGVGMFSNMWILRITNRSVKGYKKRWNFIRSLYGMHQK